MRICSLFSFDLICNWDYSNTPKKTEFKCRKFSKILDITITFEDKKNTSAYIIL